MVIFDPGPALFSAKERVVDAFHSQLADAVAQPFGSRHMLPDLVKLDDTRHLVRPVAAYRAESAARVRIRLPSTSDERPECPLRRQAFEQCTVG